MPVTRTFPANPAILRDIRRFVQEQAGDLSYSAHVDDVVLAVTEACTNSIRHSDSAEMTVRLEGFADRVEVEVADAGVFRPGIPIPEFDGEGRRGLYLMMAVMDELAIREGTESDPGTVVRLVKRKG